MRILYYCTTLPRRRLHTGVTMIPCLRHRAWLETDNAVDIISQQCTMWRCPAESEPGQHLLFDPPPLVPEVSWLRKWRCGSIPHLAHTRPTGTNCASSLDAHGSLGRQIGDARSWRALYLLVQLCDLLIRRVYSTRTRSRYCIIEYAWHDQTSRANASVEIPVYTLPYPQSCHASL
jgi:hypothetical protein